MTRQGLWAAAALLAAVALANSCGPAATPCGPSTCSGCCDPNGTCITSPNNALSQTCGKAGVACQNCLARNDGRTQCLNFTCGGSGGGAGGGAGGGDPACSSANCGGCCSGDVCIAPNQQSALNCGRLGNQCLPCSGGLACSFGVCVLPDGGAGGGAAGGGAGGGAGCSSTNCTGCCSGTTCVAFGSQNAAICGRQGATCFGCGVGEDCANGACFAVDAGRGFVGDPCSDAGQCVNVPTGGTGGVSQCHTRAQIALIDGGQSATGYQYPRGYCTRRCLADSDCGAGASCMYWLGAYGEGENICVADCQTWGCRSGYVCVNFGTVQNPVTGCLVAAADGGLLAPYNPGTGALDSIWNQGCTDHTQCQLPSSGRCMNPVAPDGGHPYVGGVCSADCTMAVDDAWCGPTKGICLPWELPAPGGSLVRWSCRPKCNYNLVPNGCRTPDYACEPLNGVFGVGQCVPSCYNQGADACPTSTSCDLADGRCK